VAEKFKYFLKFYLDFTPPFVYITAEIDGVLDEENAKRHPTLFSGTNRKRRGTCKDWDIFIDEK